MNTTRNHATEFISLLRENKNVEKAIKECVVKTLNQSSQRSS